VSDSHLLPQLRFERQAGAGSDKPAVTHKPLVQVVGADAFHEQVRLLADLLCKNVWSVIREI